MRFGRRALAAVLIVLAVLWGSSRVTVPGQTGLELTDAGSGRIIASRLLRDGDEVVLTWRNSLFDLMVTEVFEARGGVLVLTRVTFADPRGGEPPRVRPEDLDDLYHTGGPFGVEGLAKPVRRVVFRVGEIGQPRMRIGEQVVDLTREVGFGGAVLLLVRKPTVFDSVAARIIREDYSRILRE